MENQMTDNERDLMQREMSYQLSMQISKALLKRGLLTPAEYAEIDTILRQKFRPSLSIFISENA